MASHEAMSYVRNGDIKQAIKGQEQRILDALHIAWPRRGKTHIDCPYSAHGGKDDWRWDDKRAKAFCTCISGAHSALDVIATCEGIDFEDTKVRAAEIVGRPDLIKTKQANGRR